MNNKILYDKIIKNISKQVKKALNETAINDILDDNSEDMEFQDIINNKLVKTFDELKAIVIQRIKAAPTINGVIVPDFTKIYLSRDIDILSEYTVYDSGTEYRKISNGKGLFSIYIMEEAGLTGNDRISIDISSWDVSNVSDFSNMFNSNTYVVSINMTGLDLSNLSSLNYMCEDCKNLESINFNNVKTNNNHVGLYRAFRNCNSLIKVNLKDLHIKPWGLEHLFFNCKKLEYLDISNFDLTDNDYSYDDEKIFGNLKQIKEIHIPKELISLLFFHRTNVKINSY